MNQDTIIKKISKLLGLYQFNSYKLKEGSELICEGIKKGNDIYMVTEEGQIPCKDGEYELEDSTKIKIEEGKISQINYSNMEDNKNQKFVEAALKDGTIVKSPTFDVGEDVYVVAPDGSESPAPDGEHEIMLKDAEDKEVKIRFITKDGKIVERLNVEEEKMEDDLSDPDMEDDYKKQMMSKLDDLLNKFSSLEGQYKELSTKVEKFSKAPAGNPIVQPKNQMIEEIKKRENDHLTTLINLKKSIK